MSPAGPRRPSRSWAGWWLPAPGPTRRRPGGLTAAGGVMECAVGADLEITGKEMPVAKPRTVRLPPGYRARGPDALAPAAAAGRAAGTLDDRSGRRQPWHHGAHGVALSWFRSSLRNRARYS